MSDSVRPHRRQPTRLRRPWDSPGKNSGGGCHFLLQCMKEKSESEVAQSCPTPSDPMDYSLPGSSVHGFSRQEYWSGVPLPSPANMSTYTHSHIHTHTHIHTCLYSSSCTHVYLHTQTSHALIHAHSYTHKHLRGHTLTHIRTCARWHLKDVSSVVFCVLPVSGS